MSLSSWFKKKTKFAKRQSLIAASLVASISTVASMLVVISVPTRADACRDCPFPMKIAEGRWLMPNRQLEVQITEVDYGRYVETNISVMLANSHEVLAQGAVRQRKGRRNINISLVDSAGQPAEAEIRWLDNDRDKVQISLACGGECAFSQFLK